MAASEEILFAATQGFNDQVSRQVKGTAPRSCQTWQDAATTVADTRKSRFAIGEADTRELERQVLERYDSGVGVATYLAGYLKGGPIGNSRLIKIEDGEVFFRYRLGTHEGGDGKRRGTMSLPIDQFIGRLLEHVPPRRYQAIRGYGLYCGNQHSRIAEARTALCSSEAVADEAAEPMTWQQWCEQAGQTQSCCCPKCGATLISHSHFQPGRAPPLAAIRLPVNKEAA